MPNSPEHRTGRDFRRGYLQGAQAIIDGAARHLPESDRQTLSVWIALTLAPWTFAPTGSDSSRPPTLPKL
jgi:hypothetical protein